MLLVHPQVVAHMLLRLLVLRRHLVVAVSGSMSLISLTPKTDGTVG